MSVIIIFLPLHIALRLYKALTAYCYPFYRYYYYYYYFVFLVPLLLLLLLLLLLTYNLYYQLQHY